MGPVLRFWAIFAAALAVLLLALRGAWPLRAGRVLPVARPRMGVRARTRRAGACERGMAPRDRRRSSRSSSLLYVVVVVALGGLAPVHEWRGALARLGRGDMIRGVHTMFYTSEAEALRAFLRDKLGFRGTDVGDGWLIFDLPEADMGVPPDRAGGGAPSGTADISFYCDDIAATVAELKRARRRVHARVEDHGYGLVTLLQGARRFPRAALPAQVPRCYVFSAASRTHRLDTSIAVDATPERLWSLLTDFAGYPRWNPFVRSIAGELEVGKTLDVSVEPPGGRAMKFHPVVLAVDPGRELRWKGKLLIPGLFDGEHWIRLSHVANGHVVVEHGEMLNGLLVPRYRPAIDGSTRAGFIAMNEALKREAERGRQA